ncbi:hypothetical protein SBOR_4615 [Sclerotinia borealis F-4128]|uniref:NET domain-containing protein n=1 Tax=Sclerotinia borealis (strain F-4128) TaxID=1432307 RepID=W9CKD7_SCLBF|nr:hypothetical protein SBOR_4615 [Sclerotinia borealis F-4128]
MCKRLWVMFAGCRDIRTSERRCVRNPVEKPLEHCDTRRYDHDPTMMFLPGRCFEWEVKDDSGVMMSEHTWIVCSDNWYREGIPSVVDGTAPVAIRSSSLSHPTARQMDNSLQEEIVQRDRGQDAQKIEAPKARYIGSFEREIIVAGINSLPTHIFQEVCNMMLQDQPDVEIDRDGIMRLDMALVPQHILRIMYEAIQQHLPEVEASVGEAHQNKNDNYSIEKAINEVEDGISGGIERGRGSVSAHNSRSKYLVWVHPQISVLFRVLGAEETCIDDALIDN